MKKILVALVFVLLGGVFLLTQQKKVKKTPQKNLLPTAKISSVTKTTSNIKEEKSSNKPTITTSIKKNILSIFVPYWNIDKFTDGNYNSLLYFGVAIDENGVINDAGLNNISKFNHKFPTSKNKYLVVRMTNTSVNLNILEKNKNWEKIIKDITKIVKENGFKGVYLDLEVSSISFENIKSQISKFVQVFSREVKSDNLTFGTVLFGDSIYRKRPYDLEKIGNSSDEVVIMAYDFHKSRGEPGPNFPLNGKERYGYDMHKMIEDFTRYISTKKIGVAFGMYGYDWTVDEKNRPIGPADSMTLSEIKAKLIDSCEWQDCTSYRDPLSFEMEINYKNPAVKDQQGKPYSHSVWFDDVSSVNRKEEFLRSKGVHHFYFWAWGYF